MVRGQNRDLADAAVVTGDGVFASLARGWVAATRKQGVSLKPGDDCCGKQ
jgi:hypothetical protein